MLLAALTSDQLPPATRLCPRSYKLFGYPTGVGALIMRRDMAARMRKVGGRLAWHTLLPPSVAACPAHLSIRNIAVPLLRS